MKRYLILILMTILVISSFPLFGCGENAVNEKQVIEMTYNNLMNRAEQLQGSNAAIMQGKISWAFTSAVLDGMDDVRGKSVEIQFPEKYRPEHSIPTWTGALKKFVKPKGDGTWSVFISMWEWEWEFDERTGKVRARNSEATKLLEEITLKTYHNSKYGYYLDYPPSWAINELDEDKSRVGIFSGSLEAFVVIGVIEEEELAAYKGLQGYIAARLGSFGSQYHEFELKQATTTRLDYTYILREDAPKYEARHYFIEYGSRVYEIVASAVQPKFEYLSILYDPYNSFRFKP